MKKSGAVLSLSKKVCLLGDFAVGKTSLVRRFVYDLFEDKYLSTIGVKVSRKMVAVPKDDATIELTIMLWDLANSKEFDSIRVSYLRGTAGAVAACDLTRPSTIDGLYKYSRELRAINPGAHLILVANKTDLADQQSVTGAQIEAVARDINAPFYLTSARTGKNVDEVFRHLARLLVTRLPPESVAEHHILKTGRGRFQLNPLAQ
jgi:small GTP-binding protein